MHRIVRRFAVAVLPLLCGGYAFAELQNVMVNGAYGIKKQDRFTKVVHTFTDSATGAPALVLEPPATAGTHFWAGKYLPKIDIPPHATPAQHAAQVRTFFSFYANADSGDTPFTAPVHLAVSIGRTRFFQCSVDTPGWHPYLVDLSLLQGDRVSLHINAVFQDDSPRRLVIALPRIVQCFGPYYSGVGGLQGADGPHGMPLMYNQPTNLDWLSRNTKDKELPDSPLVLACFDVVQPATVHVMSLGHETVASFGEGVYWLPAVAPIVDGQFAYYHYAEGGAVERGQIDIVPDFMANDGQELNEIASATLR